MRHHLVALSWATALACLPLCATAEAPKPQPASKVNPAPIGPVSIPGYQAVLTPANIAPTAATTANAKVEVFGQPRKTVGHPCTLWDQEDINDYKKNLKANTELEKALAALCAAMDKRIAQPLDVPEVVPAPPTREDYGKHGANSRAISDLAIAYALTGDAKYGEYCKKLLIAYARNYPRYSHTEGWAENKYRSAHDGRLTGQFLDDGFWLMRVAFGYDLVYNLPSWTAAERKLLKNDLFNAVASMFSHPVLTRDGRDYYSQPNNRSTIVTAAVLMSGYACEDDKLINLALYGVGGTKEKPKGGVFGTHYTSQCILADGLWLEGAPAYQLGIASCGLINIAETLWHHDIDIYRHENAMLKRLLDSATALAYPDDKMTIAALHDSARVALLDDRNWVSNESGTPYAYGYRRYRDPRYIPIIRNISKSLSMTVHSGPPSLYPDLPPESTVPPRPIEHANFYAVGYGVMRHAAPGGATHLIMEYGPSGSHGHPSKLAYDLYVLGDALMPFPGVIFPYQDPMDVKWYWTSLANNCLTIDEKSQISAGNLWQQPKGTPNPEARQLCFAPASSFGVQRAWSDNLYRENLIQDRTLFQTPHYLADLYGAFATSPHKYDLAWHFRGAVQTSLPMSAMKFSEPVANGYNALGDLQHAKTDQPWTAAITTLHGKPVRIFSTGDAGVEILIGKGHFFTKSSREDEFPPTVIERREGKTSTIFGSALDISGDSAGYVKSVTQEGSLQAGYALLNVTTVQGNDLCFAAYRPGSYKAGGLETDAQQAMVLMDGAVPRAIYLAGGKSISIAGAHLTRSEPGLAYLEKTATGTYVLANPSPKDATVTVKLPALAGSSASGADAGTTVKAADDGSVTIALKAGKSVEFHLK